MQAPDPSPSSRSAWPLAFAAVAIILILVTAGLYVFQSLRDVPGDVVDKGREVLGDLERVAEAFRSGSVTTSFISYATEISGSSYFQFATLKQTEVFERRDSASTLWGSLELPDVVVQATAPVEYTFYLDLNRRWEFHLEEEAIRVLAPEIEFNTPAVDASAIRYEVREDSILRDEDLALENLKYGLTEMARLRAKENIELVRELGRRKTVEFVRVWLAQSFGEDLPYAVEVFFADEAGALQPTRRETGVILLD